MVNKSPIISIAVSCAITSHFFVHDCCQHCWQCGQKNSLPGYPGTKNLCQVHQSNEHAVLQLSQYFLTEVIQIDSEWPILTILELFQYFATKVF